MLYQDTTEVPEKNTDLVKKGAEFDGFILQDIDSPCQYIDSIKAATEFAICIKEDNLIRAKVFLGRKMLQFSKAKRFKRGFRTK